MMALVIAMAMVWVMSVSGFAEETQPTTSTYTITVKDGYKGETYTAYKIFDVNYSGSTYAYTISSDSEWFDVIIGEPEFGSGEETDNSREDKNIYELDEYGIILQESSVDGTYNVVAIDGEKAPTPDSMAKLAAKLAAELANETDENKKTPSSTGSVPKGDDDEYGAQADIPIDVTQSGPGYYFVTTTTGALCALSTTNPNVEVTVKNSFPTVDKKQSATESNYTDNTIGRSIGDTIYYQITVTDGMGTESDITVKDEMSDGLTYVDDSIDVTDNNGDAVDDSNYSTSFSEDKRTITVVLKADYVKTLAQNATVVITYQATINEKAVIKDEEEPTGSDNPNKNTVELKYNNQTTTDVVYFETYKFQLVKDDENKVILKGAKFKLYTDENSTKSIGLIRTVNADDGTVEYRRLTSSESVNTNGYTNEIEAGTPVFKGFSGTYWLEEIEAPDGYNILSDRVRINIDGNNMATFVTASESVEAEEGDSNGDTGSSNESDSKYESGGIEVVNEAGTLLPTTGGIGTTLFYIIGAILVIVAGVLLVVRRRMRNND